MAISARRTGPLHESGYGDRDKVELKLMSDPTLCGFFCRLQPDLRAGDREWQPQQRSPSLYSAWIGACWFRMSAKISQETTQLVYPLPTYSPSSQIIRVPYFTG
jgi:hypothetical protein